jgi:hypothetical protein
MIKNRFVGVCWAAIALIALAVGVQGQDKKEAGAAHLTVLKGTFLVGAGETFDKTKLQPMGVGDFIMMPKEMRHFAMVKGENIVQVHGVGPFKVMWVNPAEVVPPDAAPAEKK